MRGVDGMHLDRVGKARTRWSRLFSPRFLLVALREYGPGYITEVLLFTVLLEAFQVLGYGGVITPVKAVPIAIGMIAVGTAAGEVTFRLYRRVWAVASLTDAIAIAWAVIEATLVISLINQLLPGAYRPFRLLVPPLAAPAIIGAISLFRLAPRLFSAAAAAENRLLIVVPGTSAYGAGEALVQQRGKGWRPLAI